MKLLNGKSVASNFRRKVDRKIPKTKKKERKWAMPFPVKVISRDRCETFTIFW